MARKFGWRRKARPTLIRRSARAVRGAVNLLRSGRLKGSMTYPILAGIRGRTAYPYAALTTANPFKERMFVKHDYTDTMTFTTGTAGVFGSEEVFRLNSLFDPDFTILGHQPYGRDTLAGIYKRYKVYGVKLEVTFTDCNADGTCAGLWIQSPSESTGLANLTIQQAGEKQGVQLKFVNSTGNQKVTLGGYFNIGKVSGLSKLQFKADASDYSADKDSNPTFSPYARIAIASMTGSSTTTMQAFVRLRFYTCWYDRIALSQS